MTVFAKRLRVALAVAHLNKSDLARACGITAQSVTKWVNGRGYPSSQHLMTAANLTGASLDWLMRADDIDITSPSPEREALLARRQAGLCNCGLMSVEDCGRLPGLRHCGAVRT